MWGGTVAQLKLPCAPPQGVMLSLRSICRGSDRSLRLPPWRCALDPSGLKSLRMTSCLGNLLEPTRFHKAEYQRVVPNLHLN